MTPSSVLWMLNASAAHSTTHKPSILYEVSHGFDTHMVLVCDFMHQISLI